jgi:tetratricopeptide (TPR) repeat protein
MITPELTELLNHYNSGLELYKGRKFDGAMECFGKALSVNPNDGPSKLYLDRCKTFKETPPSEDWDGVFVMTTK